MHKSLTQYFAQNGQLVLPTIGIIKWHKQEAEWVNSTLQSPIESIIFEKSDAKPSKLFYHFLSEQLSVSYDQAIIQYDQFIDQLFIAKCPSRVTRPKCHSNLANLEFYQSRMAPIIGLPILIQIPISKTLK